VDKPKRVAVIGFDCPVIPLLQQMIAEGHLPTFKKVIEGGVFADNCLVPFPTITPPNWTTIGTGALIGTHQVTEFFVPLPGKTPISANTVMAFSSERSRAEFVWDAADKVGKKCIVLNFPASWPSHMKNGIMIGGASLTPIEYADGRSVAELSRASLCGNQLITTGIYAGAIRGKFVDAAGWAKLDEPGEEPLELAANLQFPHSDDTPAPTTWYALARQSAGEGYDTLTLSPGRDFAAAFCTLKVGEWSPKVHTKIAMTDGRERQVFFRCKLIELSDDAEEFRLFLTALADTTVLCSPASAHDKIVSPEGVPVPEAGLIEYMVGSIDLDTFAECTWLYSEWLAETATSLLKDGDWDAFFMHSHPPDFTYHVALTQMDPITNPDPVSRQAAWDCHLKVYQGQDKMLAQILEVLPPDTLVVLVSDHGAVADGPTFDPVKVLGQAGLLSMEQQLGSATDMFDKLLLQLGWKHSKIDPQVSRAIPQRGCYVYVNLKGRDPEGIVDPADYEKVQLEIIDALYTYVDPATGKRPVALALTNKDARILGLWGELVGDVVYAVDPSYASQHGQILPTAKWGIGDLRGLWVLNGPGVKQGAHLQRTVGLQDLVPTICYLTGLPQPETVDGAVIFQAFEDPDFKLHEVQQLSEKLASMEAALSGKQE
jgi:predicted AlkP superfamily phosphohydrolase/phosphomutase